MAKRKESKNLLEVQNAAKTLFANIRFQSIDNPIKTIALTSSVPDEGKTTTAWYLAQAAATAGNRVLLVEGDMRRRSMANMLQIHPANGLFAVLSGTVRLSEAMTPTSVKNLYFLDAEPSIPNPPDVLASKRMRMLNESLAKEFDYIIYDTPPVGTFVDAAVLGTIVDGVVLVVRPGRSKRTELQLAYEQLQSADANVIGLCATFVEGSGSEYYYSYYTKDGSKKLDQVVDAGVEDENEIPENISVDRLAAAASAPRHGAAGGDNLSYASLDDGAASTGKRAAQTSAATQTGKAAAKSGASSASATRQQPVQRSGISVPRSTPNAKGGKRRQAYSASPDGSVKVSRK